MELSVVIPAYNEARHLPATLARVIDYLEAAATQRYEIIVVDDGSTDRTAVLAQDVPGVRLVSMGRNRGKGAAVRAGVLLSAGKHVLITDADLSTPIEELATLAPHLDSAGLVFGSRALDSSTIAVRQPVYREALGKIFNRLLGLVGVTGIRDTQCGFKLLRGPLARELFAALVTEGFAFDVELVLLARARGHRISEIGVEWRHAEPSRVRIVGDSLNMLMALAKLRLRGVGRRLNGHPPEV